MERAAETSGSPAGPDGTGGFPEEVNGRAPDPGVGDGDDQPAGPSRPSSPTPDLDLAVGEIDAHFTVDVGGGLHGRIEHLAEGVSEGEDPAHRGQPSNSSKRDRGHCGGHPWRSPARAAVRFRALIGMAGLGSGRAMSVVGSRDRKRPGAVAGKKEAGVSGEGGDDGGRCQHPPCRPGESPEPPAPSSQSRLRGVGRNKTVPGRGPVSPRASGELVRRDDHLLFAGILGSAPEGQVCRS